MAQRLKVSAFFVMVTGEIDACQMDGEDNLYCKFSFTYGSDWSYVHGLEHGMTQIARHAVENAESVFAWNYPLEVSLKSTNVFGWPQIALSVYGLTARGLDVVKGYGSVHVPTTPGRHVRWVPLFTPQSSSMCQRLTAWWTGNVPEFFDSKFSAEGRGREVVRVRSNGSVRIVFNVATKNMRDFGYSTRGELFDSASAPAPPQRPSSPSRLPSSGGRRGDDGGDDEDRDDVPRKRGARRVAALLGSGPEESEDTEADDARSGARGGGIDLAASAPSPRRRDASDSPRSAGRPAAATARPSALRRARPSPPPSESGAVSSGKALRSRSEVLAQAVAEDD